MATVVIAGLSIPSQAMTRSDAGGAIGATAGQEAARIFGADIISTPGGESWITFDPASTMVIFGRHENSGWNRHTIHVSRRDGNSWTAPEVAPFSGTFEDRGARFSPDGQRLIFSSNRPRPGQGETARQDLDLWVVERRGNGWTEPRLLPAPISSDGNDFHASIASDGSIYFASSRPGGAGRSDLYVATFDGGSPSVRRLGPAINTSFSEPDVYIDPAQRFLILARTDDPNGVGGDDLYVSMRTAEGEWSAPRNLGAAVNTAEYEYGPYVSADGRTLYFTSHRGGQANIFEIPMRAVGMRP
jgi:Tol biopolymer transport system component